MKVLCIKSYFGYRVIACPEVRYRQDTAVIIPDIDGGIKVNEINLVSDTIKTEVLVFRGHLCTLWCRGGDGGAGDPSRRDQEGSASLCRGNHGINGVQMIPPRSLRALHLASVLT